MEYIKQPCKHCPFRSDIRPFLTPERATDLAYAATASYSSFPCHKTTESNDEGSNRHATENSKECAGFLTLRAAQGGSVPNGFNPAFEIIYNDDFEMIQAHYEEAEK